MKKLLPAAFAAICAASLQGMAATNETVVLEPVVVYASRTLEKALAMPAAVEVFDPADVARSRSADFPDFLRRKAGMDVRALNGNPVQSAIFARGFGENGFGRVKVLLDGAELNNVDMAAPNLMRVAPGNAGRVEIVHGPSPVLYGDGAVAGVVSVSTDTRDYSSSRAVSARAGTDDTYGVNFSAKGGSEEHGALYRAAYDYLSSGGWRDRSAYDIHAASAAVRENFDNGSTVGLGAGYANAFYELPGSLSRREWKRGRRTAFNKKDWGREWSGSANVDSAVALDDDRTLLIDGGFGRQFRRSFYDFGTATSGMDVDAYDWRFSPRYVDETPLFGFASKATAGFDFRYDRYSRTTRAGVPGREPRSRTKSRFSRVRFAAFAQEEFFATDELSFIAGARIECIRNRWRNDAGTREPRAKDWMGDFELGAVYRPADGLKTYLRATRFHRSAFCDELDYTADGRMLEPETGVSADAGVEWEFAREFAFSFNAYAMSMDDEIFYNPYVSPSAWGGWNGYNSNSPARTRRFGFDTEIGWTREKTAEILLRYSAVDASFAEGQYKGRDVPLVPRQRIRAEAGVWLGECVELKGGFSYTASQRLAGDFSNAHGKSAAYPLFDISVAYEPSWAEGLVLCARIDNLFDRDYCDFAGWSDYGGEYCYPARGRSASISARMEF